MDAITKFKEAAKELQNDERYKTLAIAREANEQDTELQDMIGQFNLLRMDLNNEMNKDERDTEKVNKLNIEATSLYNTIMANQTMIAYNEAKEGIERFIEYVNAILNTAIEGGDPMQVEEPVQHSCGEGGCSSCAGCH